MKFITDSLQTFQLKGNEFNDEFLKSHVKNIVSRVLSEIKNNIDIGNSSDQKHKK